MTQASLPMYDWPEVRAGTDAVWAEIREAGAARGLDLPMALTRPPGGALRDHWHAPDLVFSQTCWGPLSRGLSDVLVPLAQPDYSAFAGGRGAFYRSALVARSGRVMPVPQTPAAALPPGGVSGRLAYNDEESLSGLITLAEDLGRDPRGEGALRTGSHRLSIRAVAEGRADIAAIDCRSWALALCHEPCADGLCVIGWTSERLGLPYVASRKTDPAVRAVLTDILLQRGCTLPPGGENA